MLHLIDAVHPGPVNTTIALFGSKLVPVIVKVNACPPTGGFGDVTIPLIRAPDTANGTGFDGIPLGPFCMATVKLPSASVAVPLNCVELLLNKELAPTVHFVGAGHPGP